jgi:5'-nucleotidase
VKIDARLASFVKRLCESGRKLFIATNSGYAYTMKIMSYIFENACNPLTEPNEWKKYFDFIIVNANKPLFFQEGSMLREIDESTGSLRLGRFTGDLKKGKVFSGGSSEAFNKIAGVQGKEVLYVGDHIFGDIIKSKKEQAFRTFLVIPELTVEMKTWENTKSLLLRMQSLEFLMAEIYRINESQAQSPVNLPDINIIRKSIRETAGTIEGTYPHTLGGLLRCGSRLTYFANQVSRFADLYSATCVNLVNYPTHYLFSSPHQLMAHESALTETDDDTSKLLNQKPPLRKSMSSYVTAFDLDEEDSDEPQNGMMENISED